MLVCMCTVAHTCVQVHTYILVPVPCTVLVPHMNDEWCKIYFLFSFLPCLHAGVTVQVQVQVKWYSVFA